MPCSCELSALELTGKSTANAGSQSPPLPAELAPAWWVLLHEKGKHCLKGERAAAEESRALLHSAGYGDSNTQTQNLYSMGAMGLQISSELKVTQDAVLETQHGRGPRYCWLQQYLAVVKDGAHGDNNFVVQCK